MALFRKRREDKNNISTPTTARNFYLNRLQTMTTSDGASAVQPAPYRHIPTRAITDARAIKLQHHPTDSQVEPPRRGKSAAVHVKRGMSPRRLHRGYATSNNKIRNSTITKDNSFSALATTDRPSVLSDTPKSAFQALKSPIEEKARGSYRHIPTHAATDAFLTGAGTHAAWHKDRIERLAEHSRRLSVALADPALARANKLRFGSGSTSSLGSSRHTANSTRTSSSASVRSIDAVLCQTCKGAGIPGDKRCRNHGMARAKRGNESGSESPASSLRSETLTENEVVTVGRGKST